MPAAPARPSPRTPALLLTATGYLYFDGGTLLVNGGTVSGSVDAQGCMLDMANTITMATTVYVVGGGNSNTILVNNNAFLGTVWVEGNDTNGNATLTLGVLSFNAGTILLQSASGSSDTSNLATTVGSPYIDNSTGTIQVNPSINPSTLSGTFDNRGKIEIASGATLEIGAAGLTFTEDFGSTLAAAGTFLCDAGTFLVTGGIVSGAVDAYGCSLQMISTITMATTINVVGGNGPTTLLSNDARPSGRSGCRATARMATRP